MPRSVAIRNVFATALLALTLGAAAGCQHTRPPSPGSQPGNEVGAAEQVGPHRAAGSSVDAAELKPTRAARAEELLEGRFAGVQVFRYPGGISIRIRGTSSLLGSNEPLYVVDGITVAHVPGGALLGINPQDIERIEVLKDIGSTSFYGVQGANGVVLITTKQPR